MSLNVKNIIVTGNANFPAGTLSTNAIAGINSGSGNVNLFLNQTGTFTAPGFTGITGTLGVSQGGTGNSGCIQGDMLYGSGINTYQNLGIGTNGQVLTVVGGLPTWTALPSAPASSVYVQSTDAVPQVLYAGTIALSRSQIIKLDLCLQDNTNNKAGSYAAYFQVKQSASGAPNVAGPFNVWSYIDPIDSGIVVSIAAGAQGLYDIMVQGLAATDIRWGGKISVQANL